MKDYQTLQVNAILEGDEVTLSQLKELIILDHDQNYVIDYFATLPSQNTLSKLEEKKDSKLKIVRFIG